jgi:deoxyribodipyrimidine photo-lyase
LAGSKPPSERFRADRKNTARISPYMHFGELGPRQVYHRVLEKQVSKKRDQRSINTFLRRLAWRDLAYWALWRFPNTSLTSMRPQYEGQRWDLGWGELDDTCAALAVKARRWGEGMRCAADPRLRAWQRGETGYPLVDAAMQEMWVTGYMTNYMRCVRVLLSRGVLCHASSILRSDVQCKKLRIVTGGFRVGDELTPPFHDTRRFPSTQL